MELVILANQSIKLKVQILGSNYLFNNYNLFEYIGSCYTSPSGVEHGGGEHRR